MNTKQMIRKFLKNGGTIKICKDSYGIPMSNCTAIPKSERTKGVIV